MYGFDESTFSQYGEYCPPEQRSIRKLDNGRYVVINHYTGRVVDDFNGHGYGSYQEASMAWTLSGGNPSGRY